MSAYWGAQNYPDIVSAVVACVCACVYLCLRVLCVVLYPDNPEELYSVLPFHFPLVTSYLIARELSQNTSLSNL